MARRPIRHTDTTLGWQVREFRALWKAIREMRAERRLGQSTVPEGGDLRVRGTLSVIGQLAATGEVDLTGDFLVKNEFGQTIIRIGDMTYGRGLRFIRDDGTPALVIERRFSNSTVQTWALRDRNDAVVASESSIADGLGRPRLSHHMQPVAATSGTPVVCGPYGFERTTGSDTWETLFSWEGRRQNPFIDFKFYAMCSDATTAGEIRAVNLDTGNQLATFVDTPWEADVPAGTTTMTAVDPLPEAAVSPGTFDAYVRVGVQVRRTAGTGSITITNAMALGG